MFRLFVTTPKVAWSLGAMKLDKQPTNPGDQAARQRVGLEENLKLGRMVSSRCEYISSGKNSHVPTT